MPDNKLTLEEYKLRLKIHKEWKFGANVDEAKRKIRQKLRKNNILKVNDWYGRFKNGDFSIFGKKSSLNVSIQNSQEKSFYSLLFLSSDKLFKNIMSTKDGRFLIFSYQNSERQYFIMIYDLFNNVKKEIPSSIYGSRLKTIGEYLLILNENEMKIYLLKINYNNWTINTLDSIDLMHYLIDIILDQLDDHKFVVKNHAELLIGQIQNDKFVLSSVKQFSRMHLNGQRLMGNKLHGFNDDDSLLKFCEIDLETMQISKFNVPIVLDDGTFGSLNLYAYDHCWSENRFYGTFWTSSKWELFMFNPETMKWLNIGITTVYLKSLFIDSNSIMTFQVGSYQKEPGALYRIALRKPDTLKNLAWFTALRESTLYGNDKYLECVRQLSIQL